MLTMKPRRVSFTYLWLNLVDAFVFIFQLYDIHKMAKLAGMESGSSVLGAGGCPNHAPDTTAEVNENKCSVPVKKGTQEGGLNPLPVGTLANCN